MRLITYQHLGIEHIMVPAELRTVAWAPETCSIPSPQPLRAVFTLEVLSYCHLTNERWIPEVNSKAYQREVQSRLWHVRGTSCQSKPDRILSVKKFNELHPTLKCEVCANNNQP